eukprot:scaffold2911_cov414-Prasinococcus_capsulatus_cf.AAC.45
MARTRLLLLLLLLLRGRRPAVPGCAWAISNPAATPVGPRTCTSRVLHLHSEGPPSLPRSLQHPQAGGATGKGQRRGHGSAPPPATVHGPFG